MSARPPMRCTHYAPDNGPRCTADATHRLLDSDGWRVPGGIYCQEHTQEIVDECHEQLGWYWVMDPLEEEIDE